MRLISFGDEDGKFAFVGLQPCFAEFKMPFRTKSNKKSKNNGIHAKLYYF